MAIDAAPGSSMFGIPAVPPPNCCCCFSACCSCRCFSLCFFPYQCWPNSFSSATISDQSVWRGGTDRLRRIVSDALNGVVRTITPIERAFFRCLAPLRCISISDRDVTDVSQIRQNVPVSSTQSSPSFLRISCSSVVPPSGPPLDVSGAGRELLPVDHHRVPLAGVVLVRVLHRRQHQIARLAVKHRLADRVRLGGQLERWPLPDRYRRARFRTSAIRRSSRATRTRWFDRLLKLGRHHAGIAGKRALHRTHCLPAGSTGIPHHTTTVTAATSNTIARLVLLVLLQVILIVPMLLQILVVNHLLLLDRLRVLRLLDVVLVRGTLLLLRHCSTAFAADAVVSGSMSGGLVGSSGWAAGWLISGTAGAGCFTSAGGKITIQR
uniref:Uncharacterized protein n=1 Tax=Anopheles coluzzii TaxID=1518534 RepID=A0A8W7Q1P6_ANOCL